MRHLEFKKTGDDSYEMRVHSFDSGSPSAPTDGTSSWRPIHLTREEWLKAVELITEQMDAESEAVAQRWGRVAAVIMNKDPDDVGQHPWAASMTEGNQATVDRLIALYERDGFEVGYVQSLISPDTNVDEARTSGLTPGGFCR